MPGERVTVWVQHFKDREALVLQWIDPDTGKRKSKSAGTADRKEAERRGADLEYELNHGRYQEASRMTWERFRELFEAEYVSGLRPCTQSNYGDTLDMFERIGSPSRVRSINERTVSTFVAGMRQVTVRGRARLGLMPSTIKVRLQFLHTALAWAVVQKLLPSVPQFPSVKVPLKKPQPVPGESFERLLDKAPDAQMRAYLLCGWMGGLRLSEAFTLEWERSDAAPWVDLAANRIWLPAEFVKAVEDQWIPLDRELREALEALPRYGKRVFRFLAPDGHPIQPGAVCDRVRRLAKLAGVKLTMHSLRKGFGCRYAGKVPAQVLQRLMRHSDIKTTMTYYANIDVAVEDAIFGNERNTVRNRPAACAATRGAVNDASPSQAADKV